MIDFSFTGLPLVSHLPKISELLARQRRLVLTAEPGAGKSTLVPPFLMDEPWLSGRAIVMLEPRRLAAASVAARIAELLGEPVGVRAGYRVRTASRVSRETRIEVVTEALLTRRIQEDPLLEGVGLVILDEFHERSVHADLALALSIEVSRARPELALLVMSATLDSEPVAALLRGGQGESAPALHCPGTLHPVTTRYRLSARGTGGKTALPTAWPVFSMRPRVTSLHSFRVPGRSAGRQRGWAARWRAARKSCRCTAPCAWRTSRR